MGVINFNVKKVDDPGDGKAIPVGNYNIVCNLVTAGAGETRTLADPAHCGQTCTITVDTDGGSCDITAASVINKAGNNVMAFSHLRDSAFLVAVTAGGALRWQIMGNDDVTLS